ncbi:hypothetical protein TNCT_475241 [Trichonephila clavata]|uniref:Uncharacterized protein n=1 Tax=Trichonephila clavata TaxID=2740835 RepID=A0A8X6FGE9_TRICU|nr:hypothetical protein TNCT_475241 [Trichonephila clavata]
MSSVGLMKTIRKMNTRDLLTGLYPFKLRRMATFDSTTAPHFSLSFSKVISSTDLFNAVKMLENMRDHEVWRIQWITIKRDQQVLNMKHLILIHAMPELSQCVKATIQSSRTRS